MSWGIIYPKTLALQSQTIMSLSYHILTCKLVISKFIIK